MAMNETVTGVNSVAIAGTASGENSRGVIGKGEGTSVVSEGNPEYRQSGFYQVQVDMERWKRAHH